LKYAHFLGLATYVGSARGLLFNPVDYSRS
jgi:hypothetical protein